MIFKKNLIMGGDHLHKSDSYSTEFMISSADDWVLDWMRQEQEFVAFKWKGNLASQVMKAKYAACLYESFSWRREGGRGSESHFATSSLQPFGYLNGHKGKWNTSFKYYTNSLTQHLISMRQVSLDDKYWSYLAEEMRTDNFMEHTLLGMSILSFLLVVGNVV